MLAAGPLLNLSKTGKVLVCCAHPDDEMGIFSTLAGLVREGHEVHLVFGTSGEASSAKVAGTVREKESRAAMKRIGIAKDNLHFLRLPDGKLVDTFGELVHKLGKAIRKVGPQSLLSVAYEGGHLDHDCVNAAAFLNTRETAVLPFEFPTYHRHRLGMAALKFARGGPASGKVLYYRHPDQLALYDELKQFYASQLKGLEKFEKVINLSHRKKYGEAFRQVADHRNYLRAPGPRPLLYELMPFPKQRRYEEFRKAYKGYWASKL